MRNRSVLAAAQSAAKFAWKYSPFLMVLVAFLLRVAIALFGKTFLFPDHVHRFPFGGETGSIAGSVAEGHGFCSPFWGASGPTAWIGPIYVYLCAAVFEMFGVFTQASATVLLAINCLVSAINAAVIYMLGARTGNKNAGLVAGWAWAVIPQFMVQCTRWIWETSLSALLLTLAVLFAIELTRDGGKQQWILYGAFWGVTGLTNPALLTLFPISLLWIGFHWRRERRSYLKPVLIGALFFMVTTSPWLVRNRVVFGRWVFIRSNFAFEFYLDNHFVPEGQARFDAHPTVNPAQFEKYRSMGELAFVDFYKRAAVDYVRSSPLVFLKRTAWRFEQIWTSGVFLYIRQANAPPVNLQLEMLLSLLTFAGLGLGLSRRLPNFPFFAFVILLYPVPYYLTNPSGRYRHPVEPVMVFVAALFFIEAFRIFRDSHTKRKGMSDSDAMKVAATQARFSRELENCSFAENVNKVRH